MLMSEAVCQSCYPDPMEREADHGGRNHSGDRDWEAQAAAGESKGGETPDATETTREGREGEERGRQVTDAHTTHNNPRRSAERREQPNNDNNGGGREGEG